MLKQTIKYKDLNENDITEDFYFHLNKAELAKMILTHGEGIEDWLQTIIDSKDGQLIIDTFEEIVKAAYGVRSENGTRFIKDEEHWLNFFQSDAYSEFFMKLVTDAGFASTFVTGLVPSTLSEQVAKEMQDVNLPELQKPDIPKDPKNLTPEHIMMMDDEQFAKLDSDRSVLVAMPSETLLAMYQRKNK